MLRTIAADRSIPFQLFDEGAEIEGFAEAVFTDRQPSAA
jgi:hypothetical protein